MSTTKRSRKILVFVNVRFMTADGRFLPNFLKTYTPSSFLCLSCTTFFYYIRCSKKWHLRVMRFNTAAWKSGRTILNVFLLYN